jgi:hypothetical protein
MVIVSISKFSSKQSFDINWGEIVLLLFFVYVYFRTYFFGAPNLKLFLYLNAFILLYWIISSSNIVRNFISLSLLILFPVVTQAIYGLFQTLFLFPESFDNTAGFVVSISCGLPFCFYLFSCNQKWIRVLAVSSASCIILAVIISGSRSGILAIVCCGGCFYWNNIKLKICRYKRNIRFLVFLLFFIFLVSLYFMKKDSADGRILIWHCTYELFKNKPLLGYGVDGFTANYMLSQADFFMHNSQHHFEILADNVKHPFNEFLKLGVEQGLIGIFFIFFVILWYIRVKKKNNLNQRRKVALSFLLSLGIFANFSYPLNYPFVWIGIILSIVILFNGIQYMSFNLRIRHIRMYLYFLICFIIFYNAILFTCAQIKWMHLIKQSVFKETNELIVQYENLKPILKNEPIFFYNYARDLFERGRYEESIQNLSICREKFNDTDVLLLLAENCMKLKNYVEAERILLLTSYMCPNRFIPLYKLVLLYDYTGNYLCAKRNAQIIIDKKIKVQSSVVYDIKKEMLIYLQTIDSCQ